MTEDPKHRPATGPDTGKEKGTGRGDEARRDGDKGHDFVRPAGPDQMKDKPKDWDIVDEEVDESFPASDPPANY